MTVKLTWKLLRGPEAKDGVWSEEYNEMKAARETKFKIMEDADIQIHKIRLSEIKVT